jgi:signal transduction histidine kinase
MGIAARSARSAPGERRRVADHRADIEHRVRTELTTISVAGQLIQRNSAANERLHRLGGEIVAACARLQECVDELLQLREPDTTS